MGERVRRLWVLCACALVACSGQPARHVVSVSAATTRVAEALGLGDRLESIDPGDPRALERALASRASLVISDASPESAQIRAAFASRAVAVRVFAPTSTADVASAYTEIATVLGRPRAAGALLDRVTRELASRKAAGAPAKVALTVSRAPLRVVAGDAYLSHLLASAGLENVFAAEKGVTVVIRPEQLEARAPERVLDVSPATLAGAWVDPVESAASLLGAAP